MPGDDHWLNFSNANRPTLVHYPLHGWLYPLSLRSVLIMLSKHWHYTLNTSKVDFKNGRGYLLLTVRSIQCYYWRLQVVARLSGFYFYLDKYKDFWPACNAAEWLLLAHWLVSRREGPILFCKSETGAKHRGVCERVKKSHGKMWIHQLAYKWYSTRSFHLRVTRGAD